MFFLTYWKIISTKLREASHIDLAHEKRHMEHGILKSNMN